MTAHSAPDANALLATGSDPVAQLPHLDSFELTPGINIILKNCGVKFTIGKAE
jgi:hypothetical protein